MGHPKPFDVVAVLQPIIPEALQLTEECYDLSAGLAAGTVGTVVAVVPRPFFYGRPFYGPRWYGPRFAYGPYGRWGYRHW